MLEKKNSKSVYKVKTYCDVPVTMRDGVVIYVDIFRPDTDGKFPALVAISPYGKEMQSLPIPPMPSEAPLYNISIEAGDPEYLVSRGYVMMITDERGIGKSGGEYTGWMSKQEAEDGYDMVEWIAQQPWCDGNVGMVGISYFGCIQPIVAAEKPPHLKAIMPYNAPADFYRECAYHGGTLQSFFFHLYRNCIRGNTVSVTAQQNTPEEFERLVEGLKSNPDIRMYPDYYNVVSNYRWSPCFFDVIANPEDGPFYWERSAYTKYDKINIPCYCGSGWWAYAHMHLRGAFQNYLGIDAPKKLFINRPVVFDRPMPQKYNEEVIRWYDYWLKGEDTGIMDEPPINIFVRGDNRWRFEYEWPLKRAKWTKFYLHDWQRLTPLLDEFPSKPACFTQRPLDETYTIESVSYFTEPMSEDMEITGPIALYMYASISADDTNWMVGLIDVAPDNSEVDLSRGWLKASHRAIDESKSEVWEPYHPHVNPTPVVSGEIYEYAISLSPISNVFKAGHRIKLKISNMDHSRIPFPLSIGSTHLPYHMCSSNTVTHKIYHDLEHPTHLLLPIIPRNSG